MSERATTDNLNTVFMKVLDDFKDATVYGCKVAVEETAKECVNELHVADPPGSGQYRDWNKYNKSWTYKEDPVKAQAVIYNKKYYRLTHLLEKGHAKVNGGRTRAFPHIAPVAEEAEEKLIRRIKNEI